MAIFPRIPRYKVGYTNETTEADVRALLADDTERARLEKEAKETVLRLRGLVNDDPRAVAYTIAAGDDVCDLMISYHLAFAMMNWVLPLYRILREHPIIEEMEKQRLAVAVSDGEVMTMHAVEDHEGVTR